MSDKDKAAINKYIDLLKKVYLISSPNYPNKEELVSALFDHAKVQQELIEEYRSFPGDHKFYKENVIEKIDWFLKSISTPRTPEITYSSYNYYSIVTDSDSREYSFEEIISAFISGVKWTKVKLGEKEDTGSLNEEFSPFISLEALQDFRNALKNNWNGKSAAFLNACIYDAFEKNYFNNEFKNSYKERKKVADNFFKINLSSKSNTFTESLSAYQKRIGKKNFDFISKRSQ